MEAEKRIKLTRSLTLVVGIDLMKPALFIEIEVHGPRDERGFFVSPELYREQVEKSLMV